MRAHEFITEKQQVDEVLPALAAAGAGLARAGIGAAQLVGRGIQAAAPIVSRGAQAIGQAVKRGVGSAAGAIGQAIVGQQDQNQNQVDPKVFAAQQLQQKQQLRQQMATIQQQLDYYRDLLTQYKQADARLKV